MRLRQGKFMLPLLYFRLTLWSAGDKIPHSDVLLFPRLFPASHTRRKACGHEICTLDFRRSRTAWSDCLWRHIKFALLQESYWTLFSLASLVLISINYFAPKVKYFTLIEGRATGAKYYFKIFCNTI